MLYEPVLHFAQTRYFQGKLPACTKNNGCGILVQGEQLRRGLLACTELAADDLPVRVPAFCVVSGREAPALQLLAFVSGKHFYEELISTSPMHTATSVMLQESGEPVASSSMVAWSDIAACLLEAQKKGLDLSDTR